MTPEEAMICLANRVNCPRRRSSVGWSSLGVSQSIDSSLDQVQGETDLSSEHLPFGMVVLVLLSPGLNLDLQLVAAGHFFLCV